jgi:hypothetical protein
VITFFKQFFDICRFEANPQDLPSSYFVKYLALGSYAVVALASALLSQSLAYALISVFVDMAMLVGLAYAGLWVRNLSGRTTQTVTALAGTGTVIGIAGFPVMAWLQSTANDPPLLTSLLLLALVIWNVAVIGHILRHALSLPLWAGMGISVFYVYTSIRVMSALFIASS